MPISTRESLLQELVLQGKKRGSRKIIGLAGAPGSGKSTLAKWLIDNLNSGDEGVIAAVLPQDGFHYDDQVLKHRGRLECKGAPDTFDVNGLYAMLKRSLVEPEIAVPVFDRELEISRNCAQVIEADTRVLIVEGNYLLMDKPASWRRLRRLFDMSIFLQVPTEILEQRLITRWLKLGLAAKHAEKKVFENDMPNAANVVKHSADPDWIVT